MDNKCLVIMPDQEPVGYAPGHFGRVYEYVIMPACRAAGFWPSKIEASPNAIDGIKDVVDSDAAIFDVSTNNQNGLYGLVVRHSLKLPFVIVKDQKTFSSFGLGDFTNVEYDDSLRIDTVQKAISQISEALKQVSQDSNCKHEIIDRLGLGVKYTPQAAPVVEFTSLDLTPEPAPHKETIPVIWPVPDYVGDALSETEVEKVKIGDTLFHINYGKASVKAVRKVGKDRMAELTFDSGHKVVVLNATGTLRKVI